MTTSARASIGGWLAWATAVVVLDQVTKIAIQGRFEFGERVAVIPGFFDLTLLYNRGAAFSFLAEAAGWQRWFFIVLGITASGFIVWLLRRHGSQRLFASALTLILGGAIGNVIDRIAYGHVVDFVLLYWQDHYWPAFNVADSAITVGAVLLIADELRRMRQR